MARTPFRETEAFLRGRAGEQRVVRWLQMRSWYVIPSYDYSGESGDKAPRMQGVEDGIRSAFPVPDLDVCRRGTRRWVEVKTKEASDWTFKTRRFEHGIEHYDDYVRVAAETGTEAWLAVYETTTISTAERLGVAGALLVQSFANLGEPRRSTMNGKRMAFWARDAFKLADILAPDPADGRAA